jgi:hypothetical protein
MIYNYAWVSTDGQSLATQVAKVAPGPTACSFAA